MQAKHPFLPFCLPIPMQTMLLSHPAQLKTTLSFRLPKMPLPNHHSQPKYDHLRTCLRARLWLIQFCLSTFLQIATYCAVSLRVKLLLLKTCGCNIAGCVLRSCTWFNRVNTRRYIVLLYSTLGSIIEVFYSSKASCSRSTTQMRRIPKLV